MRNLFYPASQQYIEVYLERKDQKKTTGHRSIDYNHRLRR
jgi:hypothetical protein